VVNVVFFVKPFVAEDKAVKQIENSLKGLTDRKGDLKRGFTLYYPFYEIELNARPKLSRQGPSLDWSFLVDGIEGSPCNYVPSDGIIRLGD